MPNPLNISNIPAPRVEFIDPRTGLMAREWYRFFFNLFNLAGGGTNDTSLSDLQVGPPPINQLLGELGIVYDQAQLASMMVQYEQSVRNIINEIETAPAMPQLGTMAPLQQDNLPWLTFDNTPENVPPNAGTMYWDDGEGTLDVELKGGNVTCKIGVQEYVRAYNETLLTMTKGQIVYISGAQGNRVAVKLAQADGDANSAHTIGIVAETITAGGEGFVQISGPIYKLDTLGTIAGDTVYLSPTIAGDWTTTKPVAPDHLVIIGFIERVHASVGSIFIKIDNGYELDELHNVKITSAANNDLLQYDSAGPYWKNVAPSSVSVGSATNVTGIVAVANGGTGTSTAFTPGSVVFAGASGVYSQDNTNLFWDNTNKLLGIGTSTPQVALDVMGVGSFSALVYSPLLIGGTGATSSLQLRSTLGAGTTGADIVFQVGSNGATEAMRVLNNGKIGVGTTTPQSKLHVSGTGIFETASGNQVYLVKGTTPSLILHNDGTNTFFLHTASGDPYGTGNANRPLTINNTSGNVTLAQNTQFTSTYSATTGSAQIYMNATTGNRIDYNVQGINAPTFTTRSAGTKVVWYPSLDATNVDYATGINGFTLWNSVAQNTAAFFFKWYGGTTEVASLTGVGDFTVAGDVYTALGSAAAPSHSFSGDANTGIWSPGADTIAASTAGAERMRITSSGHVGIGTVPSAWVSSVRALQLGSGGSVSTWDGSNGSVTLGANLYDSGGAVIRYINSAPAAAFSADAGAFTWNTAPTGVAGNPITFSRSMTLTSAGNLLLGTTAALAAGVERLTVAGNTLTDAGGAYPIVATFADTRAYNATTPPAGGGIGFGFKYNAAGALTVGASIQGYKENTTDGDYGAGLRILTRTNGLQPAERLRIDSAGNVGIGNTIAAARLDVQGSGTANTGQPMAAFRNSAGSERLRIIDETATTGAGFSSGAGNGIGFYSRSTNGGRFVFYGNTSDVERMRIDTAGNVGIGTAAPTFRLDVLPPSGVSAAARLRGNSVGVGSNNVQLRFYGKTAAADLWAIGNDVATDNGARAFDFFDLVAATNRVRIDSAGNVGIGTIANLSTLTVNGSFASKSPSTVNAATYTVAATDGSLRFTTTNCTVTLPAAASFPGRILYLNTITANSVTSAAANVIPLGSNTAGTAILAAAAGKFAMIQSDGTNWITMMSN